MTYKIQVKVQVIALFRPFYLCLTCFKIRLIFQTIIPRLKCEEVYKGCQVRSCKILCLVSISSGKILLYFGSFHVSYSYQVLCPFLLFFDSCFAFRTGLILQVQHIHCFPEHSRLLTYLFNENNWPFRYHDVQPITVCRLCIHILGMLFFCSSILTLA